MGEISPLKGQKMWDKILEFILLCFLCFPYTLLTIADVYVFYTIPKEIRRKNRKNLIPFYPLYICIKKGLA